MLVRYSHVADERAMDHLAGFQEGSQAIFEPALHPLSNREGTRAEGKPALPIRQRPSQLRCDLLAGLPVEGFALASFGHVHCVLGHPAAVLAPDYSPFAVSAF